MPTGSDGSPAKIGYALGRSIRSHPVRSLAILIAAGVLWHTPKLTQSGRHQDTPVAATANSSNSSPAESSSGAATSVQQEASQESAEIGRKQTQTITPEQRQEIAHQLAENFRKEDLEINVIAAGMSNDTLVLSSDLFKDSASRTAVMRQLRVQWQDLLCKEGFKTVSLAESGVLSRLHDFALRCPKTVQDRAALAAGLQSDFRTFDRGAEVFASGSNNEVLSMVMTSDAYKTASNRSDFFQGLRQKGLVRSFCSDGFRKLKVYYLRRESKPSRFPLNCNSSNENP